MPHLLIFFDPTDKTVAEQLAAAVGNRMAHGLKWDCHLRPYGKSGYFAPQQVYGSLPQMPGQALVGQAIFLPNYDSESVKQFESLRRLKLARGDPYILNYRLKNFRRPLDLEAIIQELDEAVFSRHWSNT